ncbi:MULTISPECIES: YcdB/YcdC domain-containing protein [Paenibacillus]|uniref:YcdB/YcdC domain-containing protein n=1 Tax=Paenibacillus TaxID=44249 RepID=UPI0022B920C5|nr:YcdB/YcdC domain-containing protein [Paenibacillus caseinilyticus]MCZ8520379.1 DUF4901 domain-containing protein [Paenibacillus caseinilyticus]
MPMHADELRRKAEAIGKVPQGYSLQMEDTRTQRSAPPERAFIWVDPGNKENEVEVSLCLETGRLTRLKISRDDAADSPDAADSLDSTDTSDAPAPSLMNAGEAASEELRSRADAFVRLHAPEYASLTFVHTEQGRTRWYLTYREEAGGLPLPDTGCRLVLDAGLEIVDYQWEGYRRPKLERPVWPSSIAPAEQVRDKILGELSMELIWASLYAPTFDLEGREDHYRLVYDPVPSYRFIDAVTGEDLHAREHYVMPPSDPLPPREYAAGNRNGDEEQGKGQPNRIQQTGTFDPAYWEDALGIDRAYFTLEKQRDLGDSIKLSYVPLSEMNDADEPDEKDPLSADAYMKRKWGKGLGSLRGTVMYSVEKSTGLLTGLFRPIHEKDGQPVLSRAECWEKACQFLDRFFPGYEDCLQLERDTDEPEEKPRTHERFQLPVHVHGCSVNHESVTIAVSAVTGEVTLYMGVSHAAINEIKELDAHPVLTPEEAFWLYSEQLRVRLEWSGGREEDRPYYRLLYKPATGGDDLPYSLSHRQGLRYIDAITGRLLWDQPLKLI